MQRRAGEAGAIEATPSGRDIMPDTLPDDAIVDHITGRPVKDTPKEQVRQRIARALFHEYGISVGDMARDLPVPMQSEGGRHRTRKADIAIFSHGAPRELDNLRRVVVCKPEPKNGNTVTKIRTDLSNPGPADEAIRRWILDNCWILASVELPVEMFIVDANVNILTTLLFLKIKTKNERIARTMGDHEDYLVFMAVAGKVGSDRRGNPVYERRPDGEIVLELTEKKERIRIGGRDEVRVLRRNLPVIDNLPKIAAAHQEFRDKHPEPRIAR